MPWVLDGNNLAGGRSRGAVREAALALARAERVSIVVFFDGAPPEGSPGLERLGSVEVRYASNADQAILDLLAGRGRGWRLATDDRALGQRARASGAELSSAASFWAKVQRAQAVAPKDQQTAVLATEAAFFRDSRNRLQSTPGRVARRPQRGRRPKGL
jgi:hypothetical protein